MKKKITLKESDIVTPEKKRDFNIELFDEVVKSYDRATVILSFGFDKIWKKFLVDSLPDLKKGKILDIACGTGDITILLKKKYPESDISAIDINENMMRIAKSRLDSANFIKMDMNSITFNKNTFDIVTGGYALRNAPELKIFLSVLYDIMKEGSVAAFLDFNKVKNLFLQRIEIFLLKIWGNIWGWFFHRNPDIYGYIAESLKNYPVFDELKAMLKEIGFTEIRYKRLFMGFLSIIWFKK